jgi:hypothetical protein
MIPDQAFSKKTEVESGIFSVVDHCEFVTSLTAELLRKGRKRA